jgi:vitamin B12 transporter
VAGYFLFYYFYRNSTNTNTAGAHLTYQLTKGALHLNYNFNDYGRKYRNDSAHIGGFDTSAFAFYTKFIDEEYRGKSHFAELYGNINLHEKLNLVAGIDYRKQLTSQHSLFISNYGPFESLPLAEDTARTHQVSVYASLLLKGKKGFHMSLGGRLNNHSLYGSNATFSVNPSYTFRKMKVFANVASAYRVPSLYQLYSEYGNKDLKPEESVNYEAGLQYAGDVFSARVVGFRRNIQDVFVFFSESAPPFRSFYINEDRQKDQGLEAEATVTFAKNFILSANYTYVTGKIETRDIMGKDTSFSNLYRRPKNTLNANLAWQASAKAFLSTHVRSLSSFYEPKFGASPVLLKGYYTWDVYASYLFKKNIKVFADLRNITDQLYFDQEGFGTRRFNMNAGISLRL